MFCYINLLLFIIFFIIKVNGVNYLVKWVDMYHVIWEEIWINFQCDRNTVDGKRTINIQLDSDRQLFALKTIRSSILIQYDRFDLSILIQFNLVLLLRSNLIP